MFLSVIIPTRNRSCSLDETLHSLEQQTLSQDLFEIIVVDNGSTDKTQDIINKYKDHFTHYKYIYDDEPGLHIGRHDGLKASKGEVLVYADDDIIAFPTWLEGIYESFCDPDVVLVGGKNVPYFQSDPPQWITEAWETPSCKYGKCLPLLSIIDFGQEIREINAGYIYGCNFSVRKWIILEAGGFHPDGMPWELVQFRGDGETYISSFIHRNGLKAIYNPKASVYHVIPSSRLTEQYARKWGYCMGISISYSELRNQIPRIIPNANISIFKRIKHITRKLVGERITKRIFYKKKQQAQYSSSKLDILISEGMQKGKEFHLSKYTESVELQNWVHRKYYL